jgi:cytochrome c oxidase cbb3-type subunit 1
MMMIIPVVAFTVNQFQTLKGNLSALRYSPTLRFIGVGGLMYTAASIEGSFEALRSVNAVTHFTQFTIGHSHLGLYAFVTMVFFGSIYFIVPRITGRDWPSPFLIAAHFWLVTIGVAIYIVALSIGGWLQGMAMLDASRPFMDSVLVTIPYLKARSIGGAMMVLGHLVFIYHFARVILSQTAARNRPAMFRHA